MAQIQEPPSAYAAQYPFNKVKQTESGHFQEFDDTPGAERIRTQHRAGTFTEWQPDGTEVHRIIGKGYRVVLSDDNLIVEGNINVYIKGNADVTIQGNAITNIQGNLNTVVEKDYNLLVKGECSITSTNDLNLTSVTGGTYVQAGDRMVLDTDLTVHGAVLSESLFSEGDVTAGTGIHAGVPGSVNPVAGISTLGGINVGLPGPTVPGVLNAMVMVTSPIVMGTVMTYGTMLMDPTGGNPFIRMTYDSHNHIAPYGPTSGPLQLMPLP
jgi:hypothetical protein